MACIGLAVGLGYYTLTVLATICVFIVLVFLKTIEAKIFKNTKIIKIEIQYGNKKNMVEKLEKYFDGMEIKVKNIEFLIEDEDEAENLRYSTTMYTILAPKHISSSGVMQKLCAFEEIYKATILD